MFYDSAYSTFPEQSGLQSSERLVQSSRCIPISTRRKAKDEMSILLPSTHRHENHGPRTNLRETAKTDQAVMPWRAAKGNIGGETGDTFISCSSKFTHGNHVSFAAATHLCPSPCSPLARSTLLKLHRTGSSMRNDLGCANASYSEFLWRAGQERHAPKVLDFPCNQI